MATDDPFDIRQDLEEEVFSVFGKTITRSYLGSPTYNTRGELEIGDESTEDIIAVPYNIIEERRSQNPFGQLNEGDLDMALKWDQEVLKTDKYIIEGVTYKVEDINLNYLPGNVVTIIRLTKVAPVVADN